MLISQLQKIKQQYEFLLYRYYYITVYNFKQLSNILALLDIQPTATTVLHLFAFCWFCVQEEQRMVAARRITPIVSNANGNRPVASSKHRKAHGLPPSHLYYYESIT